MVFLVQGRGVENIEKKKKPEKALKSEETEKGRMQGKSNNDKNIDIIFCSKT